MYPKVDLIPRGSVTLTEEQSRDIRGALATLKAHLASEEPHALKTIFMKARRYLCYAAERDATLLQLCPELEPNSEKYLELVAELEKTPLHLVADLEDLQTRLAAEEAKVATLKTRIPSVLIVGNDSISTERALNQIKALLRSIPPVGDSLKSRLDSSLDDLDIMLKSIER